MNLGKALEGLAKDAVEVVKDAAESAAENAANQVLDKAKHAVEDAVSEVVFSCHPMRRLNLGEFQFRDGHIKIKPDMVGVFTALLAAQPPMIRAAVKLIDKTGADKLAKELLSKRVRGIDSSTNG